MKSTLKLLRRFVFILLLSIMILVILNIALLYVLVFDSMSSNGGWTAAEEIGRNLQTSGDGEFVLSQEGQDILEKYDAWAILIEDGTGNVIWHSENMPEEIPLHYSVAEISWSTRGYIKDYPTTTGFCGDNLVILGHPKDRYWKHIWNTFDYHMIANTPKTLVTFLLGNLLAVFIIYMVATSGIFRSVKPIVKGIEALPEKEVHIKEKGLLSELAASINRVSEKLRMQERALKKKEMARANWIAGVSHDIRTPLSMVMGYAGQLEEDLSLPEDARKKAGIIRLQSIRMKNLVNDLNLASKLEYNMQPMKMEPVNLVAIARQVVVDFMNLALDEKYTIEWHNDANLMSCVIHGDRDLIYRALNNIINNARNHNPDGCRISVTVSQEPSVAHILIEDDGVGVTDEQLEKLRTASHYMMSDGSTKEQRHGLGLLIVRQIAAVHHGNVIFSHGRNGGFAVEMSFDVKFI